VHGNVRCKQAHEHQAEHRSYTDGANPISLFLLPFREKINRRGCAKVDSNCEIDTPKNDLKTVPIYPATNEKNETNYSAPPSSKPPDPIDTDPYQIEQQPENHKSGDRWQQQLKVRKGNLGCDI
jgi:hypothetical protein